MSYSCVRTVHKIYYLSIGTMVKSIFFIANVTVVKFDIEFSEYDEIFTSQKIL